MTKIDEPTVRAVIARLKEVECDGCFITSVEALLPKPVDQAAELVEKFAADACDNGGSELQIHTYQLTHFAHWLLDNLHLIQPRKEWSDGEIVKELERIPDKPYREIRIAAMLRGIEMGRQLAPVDPVNPAPLTHDEIVKEAREWCGKIFPSCAQGYREGRWDKLTAMCTAIAIITAWKGEK